MSGIIFSEGSGLNNGLIGKRLAPIKAIINSNVEAFQQKSLIDKIYYMDTSKNWAENYTIETALGNFQDVGEGGATPQSEMQEGFDKTIAPRVWKNKFVVTKEMMDDMKIGKIKSKANQFTTSYGRGRESYAARMLSGATQAKVTLAKHRRPLVEIASLCFLWNILPKHRAQNLNSPICSRQNSVSLFWISSRKKCRISAMMTATC